LAEFGQDFLDAVHMPRSAEYSSWAVQSSLIQVLGAGYGPQAHNADAPAGVK
jgi:hypothetical protein